MRIGRGIALALALWGYGPLARAHGSFKGVGDFYAGILHPVTTPEHVLPFIAFGLLLGLHGQRIHALALVFPCMLIAGAALAFAVPEPAYLSAINIASAIVLGILVAAAHSLPIGLIYALSLALGLTHGLANGEALRAGSVRWYLFLPGLYVAALAVVVYAIAMVEWLLNLKKPWLRIAIRVAGSWIAAIGILVLAWQLRTAMKA